MYSIEYFKKSKIEETKLMLSRESMRSATKEERKMHLMCCDIKNLTIDAKDLFLLRDTKYTLSYLMPDLCNWITDKNAEVIRIINNCYDNKEIIYDIINTNWLIDINNYEYSNELILNKVKGLFDLYHEYETMPDDDAYIKGPKARTEGLIDNKIQQLSYYLYQLEKLRYEGSSLSEEKVIKFGKPEMMYLLRNE